MPGTYDIFVCHASEDKEQVARPLADKLRSVNLSVWYDEFSLKLGDSLRQSIDRGLAGSRYGLVILSHNFFAKRWPQNELNGLFALEIVGGEKRILPIWHDITQAQVAQYSPVLADRMAATTTSGLDIVLERILDVVDPGSQHKARLNRVVSINPISARLYTGDFAVKTLVTITNPSDLPAYAVAIRMLIQGEGVTASSVVLETASQEHLIEEAIGNIKVSADLLRFNCSKQDGRQIVLIIFHAIQAKAHRSFSIKGTVPVNSSAELSIEDVEDKPNELLTRNGRQVFVKFKATENLILNGISTFFRRRV